MKTIRYVSGGLFVAAALSLGACSVESGGTGEATGESVAFTNDQGETVAPLETLSFDGGVKVGFFEPNPGDLKVLSWGPNGTEAPITKELVDEGLPGASVLGGTALERSLRQLALREDESDLRALGEIRVELGDDRRRQKQRAAVFIEPVRRFDLAHLFASGYIDAECLLDRFLFFGFRLEQVEPQRFLEDLRIERSLDPDQALLAQYECAQHARPLSGAFRSRPDR